MLDSYYESSEIWEYQPSEPSTPEDWQSVDWGGLSDPYAYDYGYNDYSVPYTPAPKPAPAPIAGASPVAAAKVLAAPVKTEIAPGVTKITDIGPRYSQKVIPTSDGGKIVLYRTEDDRYNYTEYDKYGQVTRSESRSNDDTAVQASITAPSGQGGSASLPVSSAIQPPSTPAASVSKALQELYPDYESTSPSPEEPSPININWYGEGAYDSLKSEVSEAGSSIKEKVSSVYDEYVAPQVGYVEEVIRGESTLTPSSSPMPSSSSVPTQAAGSVPIDPLQNIPVLSTVPVPTAELMPSDLVPGPLSSAVFSPAVSPNVNVYLEGGKPYPLTNEEKAQKA